MASKNTATPRDRATLPAPFGALVLEAEGEWLVDIGLQVEAVSLSAPATPALQEAARQFEAYFQDPRRPLSLKAAPAGTPYQRRVWLALSAIPPGTAKSYAQIARELGSGPRAVAAACRANRYPLLVPCHRAVASHGLGGYCGVVCGPMLEIKRWLLRHEGYELP
jgi:methylated-DNA-[protein]-cysteine S-methyltransferase